MTLITCVNPDEIQEGDLVAYLHGDASPGVGEHVARCAYCADQVEQLRMVDAQLLAAFYRDACPTSDVLADFVLNRLPASERLRVAAHARSCAACSKEVAAVRDLADEAPPSLLSRLRETLALASIARPVAPAAALARGEGWQARFEADDLIVTLSVQADQLTGRVWQRDASTDVDYSGQAWLVNDQMMTEGQIPGSSVDRRGRFQFAALEAGSYSLLLQIGGQNFALETVQVE